ncbi:hypothetical protein NIES4102_15810 [Chondrocystis sp. NIES-4102]|nr:hypothetical protein NIES4102_15810 [Chondrocystis sp. NIES-4102]
MKANDLDSRFLEAIRAAYKDKDIEIIVSQVDETQYLLKSEANKQKLMQARENVEQHINLVEVDLQELE